MTIAQFEAAFPYEEACRAYLIARRWPNGVSCPRCGNVKVYQLASGYHWQCEACQVNGYRFSHIAGTIFENTNKPLREWFRVVHLMLTSKKGISALQVQRVMGFGSYGTAHSMCHKIRAALVEPETRLGGIVELDGGTDPNRRRDKKQHGKTGPRASGKTPIIGAVSRKGDVITRALSRVTKAAAESSVREMVSDKVSLPATDESFGYGGLTDYPRQTVAGAVHTNTVEGFRSILKRGIVGSFHKVSAKYMPLYVAEFQFRYNHRRDADIFGTAIEGC
jgi:ribosomal protein L37AE/L43A